MLMPLIKHYSTANVGTGCGSTFSGYEYNLERLIQLPSSKKKKYSKVKSPEPKRRKKTHTTMASKQNYGATLLMKQLAGLSKDPNESFSVGMEGENIFRFYHSYNLYVLPIDAY